MTDINTLSLHDALPICYQSEINDICVTSTGEHFITAGSDSAARVFQMSSRRCLNALESNSPTVCVDVSYNQFNGTGGIADQWLAAGGSDGSCRVWFMMSGALRLQLAGHASKVQACSILGERRREEERREEREGEGRGQERREEKRKGKRRGDERVPEVFDINFLSEETGRGN